MSARNRLFLLDGMALIYRAHFALIRSPIFTSTGFNSSAIFGFTNTLLDIIKKQKPTHLGVAFDTAAPTERHKVFPEYKAQRQEIPEDIVAAIPHVKRLVKAFHIPVLELDGFEADDIIGTLAGRADADGGFDTFMVTPDKDFAQLVSETTFMYKPGRQGGKPEILDLEAICAAWEVEDPKQVVDILGLWGDSSDNIPGVPGIGEKTSKKLIKQFGSVEKLLESTDQLKGKQKENVENFADQARLSKELATIILDVDVPISFDDLKRQEPNEEELRGIFSEFEFSTLGKRMFGKDFKVALKSSAGDTIAPEDLTRITDAPHKYSLLEGGVGLDEAAKRYARTKQICFDLETTSLDPRSCRILGVSLSAKAGEAVYVALPTTDDKAYAGCIAKLEDFFSKSRQWVGHNLKFDLSVLRAAGILPAGEFYDTMLAHSLVEPGGRHNMDHLAKLLLQYEPIALKSLLRPEGDDGPEIPVADLATMEPEKFADYACEDADVTWRIWEQLKPLLKEKGQERVFYEIESPLLSVLVGMEHVGVAVDVPALDEVGETLGTRAGVLKKQVFESAGEEFNLDSPKQLGEVLFERLKLIEKPKKTATGQYATNEQVLRTLANQHQIVADILDYRECTKLKSTYVDNLPHQVSSRTGRIHTTFQQLYTATGRLVSHDPNLQNIPVRTEQGREIRKAFVASPGKLLLSADYSQIELRVMASMSGDANMKAAFLNNEDIHTATAAAVYGVKPADVLPEMRRTAKMVNFGIIYGISAFGLAQRLSVPRKEAAAMIDEYFRLYPGVKQFMDHTVAEARRHGYVETITGRRRYLRDINSGNWNIRSAAERTAINTPIQGTAADMIKLAMIRVEHMLRKEKLHARMILQVHDELVLEMPEDEQLLVAPLVEQAMLEALPLEVPVVVETGSGQNWLEAH